MRITLIIIAGFFLVMAAFIFLHIGAIELIILCSKLNNLEKDTLYLAAGVLFIVGDQHLHQRLCNHSSTDSAQSTLFLPRRRTPI